MDQPSAALPRLVGSKAAHLARAARAGLPVLPGFVVPHPADSDPDGDPVSLRRAWHQLSQGGTLPLVVRSSSPQENTQESSLAGQFASVLEVRGWRDFRTAIRTVLESAHRPDGTTAPMAVLVQPMLAARLARHARRVFGGPQDIEFGFDEGGRLWLFQSRPITAMAARPPRGRNLAVGPPSIEQIYYGLSLGPGRADQPPFPVVAVSRLVDAPRRMWSRL
ncbi:PEP/pyruvate-binding domain-containing protein [Streptomyces sp. R35]|uniref:PEP/pyruvate-binding domain-containing protein n=1 Tax=Streptomyces sp. R35 TaxID=3238630 RepID=A0AB39S5P7_9ACTN